jgi:hypothetical protein
VIEVNRPGSGKPLQSSATFAAAEAVFLSSCKLCHLALVVQEQDRGWPKRFANKVKVRSVAHAILMERQAPFQPR